MFHSLGPCSDRIFLLFLPDYTEEQYLSKTEIYRQSFPTLSSDFFFSGTVFLENFSISLRILDDAR